MFIYEIFYGREVAKIPKHKVQVTNLNQRRDDFDFVKTIQPSPQIEISLLNKIQRVFASRQDHYSQ